MRMLRNGEEGVLGQTINKMKKKKMRGNSKLFEFTQNSHEKHGREPAPCTVTFEPTRNTEHFSFYITFVPLLRSLTLISVTSENTDLIHPVLIALLF